MRATIRHQKLARAFLENSKTGCSIMLGTIMDVLGNEGTVRMGKLGYVDHWFVSFHGGSNVADFEIDGRDKCRSVDQLVSLLVRRYREAGGKRL